MNIKNWTKADWKKKSSLFSIIKNILLLIIVVILIDRLIKLIRRQEAKICVITKKE